MEFNRKKSPVEYRDYELDWRTNGQENRYGGAGKLRRRAETCKPNPKCDPHGQKQLSLARTTV